MTRHSPPHQLGDDQLLVFLHMPKTGGRSVTPLLDRCFGPDLSPRKQWADIIDHQQELSRYRAVRGHIFASILDLVGARAVGAAFFRHPVDRAISEYNFIRRTPHHGRHETVADQTLLEFVSVPSNLKIYCRFLGFAPNDGDHSSMRQLVPDDELVDVCRRRIDDLGFVGITEDFEAHYRGLEKWLGAQGGRTVPRLNVDPQHRTPPPDDVVARIEELGWIDVAIYEHARSVAQARELPADRERRATRHNCGQEDTRVESD